MHRKTCRIGLPGDKEQAMKVEKLTCTIGAEVSGVHLGDA
jgi:hypothetical protein